MKVSQSLLILLVILSFCLRSFAAQKVDTSFEISKDLLAISAGESARDEALKRLRAQPRAEVVAVLKDQLKAPSSQVFALRALAELGPEYKTKEVESSIEGLAKKSKSFELIDALNLQLDKKSVEIAKVYSEKLESLVGKKKNSPLKSALLAGLSKSEQAVSESLFAKLLADDDYTVRESAVRQFLSTREKISQSAQATRFRSSLKLQPFQARLVAMEAFAELPLPELKALSQAFDEKQCATEKFEETKHACTKILESLKKAGAP